MSIPLDRLYQYIESIAREVRGDDVLIYRFFPHGSKKIEDLLPLEEYSVLENSILPQIICHDQEPLNFNFYKDVPLSGDAKLWPLVKNHNTLPKKNLRCKIGNIYDQCLLVHSELKSDEVLKYQANQYIPVYYWSHALIALDWYRYAAYCNFKKSSDENKGVRFLIYNRAWSGTREYRIKFLEQLIDHKLVSQCVTTFNAIDPELNIHYRDYNYKNSVWQTEIKLEDFFKPTDAKSSSSANFDQYDYMKTDIEVVLETLFDDNRIHLTEKILRPIALQQPFILAGTCGGLQYLQSYGFRTFESVFDESYDKIKNPKERMASIINTMKSITQWSQPEKQKKIKQMQEICAWNKQHFFSNKFFDCVVNELKANLLNALNIVEKTNTSEEFFKIRKQLYFDQNCQDYWIANIQKKHDLEKLKELQFILATARSYSSKNKY